MEIVVSIHVLMMERLHYTQRASPLIIFEVSHAFQVAQHEVDKNYNESHGYSSNHSTYWMPRYSSIKKRAVLIQEEDKMTARLESH